MQRRSRLVLGRRWRRSERTMVRETENRFSYLASRNSQKRTAFGRTNGGARCQQAARRREPANVAVVLRPRRVQRGRGVAAAHEVDAPRRQQNRAPRPVARTGVARG